MKHFWRLFYMLQVKPVRKSQLIVRYSRCNGKSYNKQHVAQLKREELKGLADWE